MPRAPAVVAIATTKRSFAMNGITSRRPGSFWYTPDAITTAQPISRTYSAARQCGGSRIASQPLNRRTITAIAQKVLGLTSMRLSTRFARNCASSSGSKRVSLHAAAALGISVTRSVPVPIRIR